MGCVSGKNIKILLHVMESNFVAKRATEISFYKKKGLLLRNDLITARKYSH